MSTAIDRTNYTALVDDDGTGTTGSNWNKSAIQNTLLDPIDAMFNGTNPFYFGGAVGVGTYTTTSTGTKNDWDIDTDAGLSVGHLRCNNASLLTITGIKAPTGSRVLFISSVGAGQVDIKNQDTGSATAGNRIINQVTGTISLAAGVGWAMLMYDATTARWRVIHHEQGAAITPTFSGSNFTGDGTITWTVDSGDALANSYYLKGKRLFWQLTLANTSTGGGASANLRATIPNSLTAAGNVLGPVTVNDNGTTGAGYYQTVSAGNTYVQFVKAPAGNWNNAAANVTGIFAASMCFEVQ